MPGSINYVMLPILEFWRYVNGGGDARELADRLLSGEAPEGSFARQLLDAAEAFRAKKSLAGSAGAAKRWADSPKAAAQPPKTSEMYDFCRAHGLDEADARDWWDIHANRGWKDKDGKPIKVWRAALAAYCNAKRRSRR